jgi:transposase
MEIIAIDLAMNKSVVCIYNSENGEHRFVTIHSNRQEIHDLLVENNPDHVVIEICTMAGWVYDFIRLLGIEVKVANPTNEAWKWKNVKRKTDRDDALKLAQLSAIKQLPTVYMPDSQTRQWRKLINYRDVLSQRMTAIKNSIRALLLSQGIVFKAGKGGWTQKTRTELVAMTKKAAEAAGESLWRYQLGMELQYLEQSEQLLKQVNLKLDEIGQEKKEVQILQSTPGVGPRLAEAVAAYIDKPERFSSGKQVGCYAGLTPRQFQSGNMDRRGRISKRGNTLLRKLLVSVSWQVIRYNDYFRRFYCSIVGPGHRNRKKAIVAVARKLLVCCWAMLRDGSRWREPKMMNI